MGLKSNRFISQVDNELICFICSCVLEKPVQVAACQHAFCNECIQQRLINNEYAKCAFPSCEKEIVNPIEEIIAAPRILIALLKKLEMKCDFEYFGCDSVVKLEELADHVKKCNYDPKERPCVIGCGRIITAEQQLQHQCEQEDFIRILNDARQEIQVLTEKQTKMDEMGNMIVELERFSRNSMKEMNEKVVAMEKRSTKFENITKKLSLELNELKGVMKQVNTEWKGEKQISTSQIGQNNLEETIKNLEEKYETMVNEKNDIIEGLTKRLKEMDEIFNESMTKHEINKIDYSEICATNLTNQQAKEDNLLKTKYGQMSKRKVIDKNDWNNVAPKKENTKFDAFERIKMNSEEHVKQLRLAFLQTEDTREIQKNIFK